MTLLKTITFLLITTMFMACSTSQAVHNGFLQKRKYNKGFYWSNGNKEINKSSESIERKNLKIRPAPKVNKVPFIEKEISLPEEKIEKKVKDSLEGSIFTTPVNKEKKSVASNFPEIIQKENPTIINWKRVLIKQPIPKKSANSRKTPFFTILAMVSLGVIVILLLLAFMMSFGGDATALLILAGVFFLASLVFSILGFTQALKHPDDYKQGLAFGMFVYMVLAFISSGILLIRNLIQ